MTAFIKRWGPELLFAAVLAVAGGYAWLNFRFESSMARLLPPASQELSMLAQRIVDSTTLRTMALSVGPASPDPAKGRNDGGEAARRVARRLGKTLAADAAVSWVQLGPDPDLSESIYNLYFPKRYAFYDDDPERLAERLRPGGLKRVVATLKENLGGPSGMMLRRLAPRDPLLAFSDQLSRLEAARPRGLSVVDGQFMSADGHAVILIGLGQSALDGAANRNLLERLRRALEHHARDAPGLVLERSGINLFAVDSETSIRSDITRVAGFSTLGILLLFGVLFRSLRSLVVAAVPLLAGFILAVTACLLVFGEIHGLALAFGASLLGVGIDYPVHFLNHRGLHREGSMVPVGLRKGLSLGAATTVLGIGALAASGFEVMKQLALFSAVGLLTALLVTLVMLPRWPDFSGTALRRRISNGLASWVARRSTGTPWLAGACSVALTIGVLGLWNARWSDQLESLAPLSETLRAEDGRVRARVGTPETSEFVIAVGADEAEALANNDKAFQLLGAARDQGLLGGFQSLHTWLWSPKLQRQNLEAVAAPSVAEDLSRALTDAGFKAEAFAPFFRVQRALDPDDTLSLAELERSKLGKLVQSFVLRTEHQVAILTFPYGVSAAKRLQQRFARVSGVHFVDQRQLLDTAYRELQGKVRMLLLVGALCMALLVTLRFRRRRLVLTALLPASVAPVTALGLVGLFGESLNLFHLLAALLVLSMAMDYGIYLAETSAHGDARDPLMGATLLSVLIAATTTCLSFGLLAFSSVPALEAIGQTVALGIAIALLLAAASSPLGQKAS